MLKMRGGAEAIAVGSLAFVESGEAGDIDWSDPDELPDKLFPLPPLRLPYYDFHGVGFPAALFCFEPL
jgi:hypothetical protein